MIRRIGVLMFVTLGLSACGSLTNPTSFWRGSEYWNSADPADRALASIERGDYATAKRHADAARRRNATDPYALFASALVYQNIGQPQMAYDYYLSILSIQPPGTIAEGARGNLRQRPLVDVACDNLMALKRTHPGLRATHTLREYDFSPTCSTTRTVTVVEPATVWRRTEWGAAPVARDVDLSKGSTARPYDLSKGASARGVDLSKGASSSSAGRVVAASASSRAAATGPTHGINSVDWGIPLETNRLLTLKKLYDQGLITGEEYTSRLTANKSYALPFSSPTPPAAGLERTAPTTQDVSSRLRAIGESLEKEMITPAQHTAERTAILDHLLPPGPAPAGIRPPIPSGRELVARHNLLEAQKREGIITADEEAREQAAMAAAARLSPPRTAVGVPTSVLPSGRQDSVTPEGGTDLSVQPRLGVKTGQVSPTISSATPPASSAVSPSSVSSSSSDFRPVEGGSRGAHLASLSTEAAALDEWSQLQRRYPDLLGNLRLSVTRTDLGARGIFYQVKAGPLDTPAVGRLCRAVKARAPAQYCEAGNF